MAVNSAGQEILAGVNTTSLGGKIESINSFIKSKHDTTCFIYFKVNQFELDTRSSDSFKHFAISLKNEKTGVGQGNTFTIEIAYNKRYSNDANDINKTINEFERSLSNLNDFSLGRTKKYNPDKNKCYLKYGYIEEGRNYQTSEYEGLLLKYTVNANQQIVRYTLIGYTGEKAAIGTVSWYPKVKTIQDNGSDSVVTLMTAEEVLALSDTEKKNLTEKLNSVYTGKLKVNPYEALRIFLGDYNATAKAAAVKQNVTPVTFKVTCASANIEQKAQNLRPVSLSLCRNQTPLDYIKYLVSMFTDNSTDSYALQLIKEKLKIVERWVYELRYSKETNNSNGIVIEVRLNFISSNENEVYDYNFKGYTLDNVLLIDYSLNYDGTVALSVSNTDSGEEDNTIYVNSEGKLVNKAVPTRDLFVEGELDEILVQKQNDWLDLMSCSNNCTMTTVGLPFEIPVGSIFNVQMYIDETPHHSSGRCYVTGITDNISNGNFTTTFNMIRLPGRGSGVV